MTNEQKLKRAFAEAWLRNPNNMYAGAMELTRNDPFMATRLCDQFLFDEEVKAYKRELIDEHGEEHFLPTKTDMLHQIMDRAIGATEEGFVKMMKLAADMRGFIEKPGVTINNNSLTNNRVMVVPVGRLNDDGTVDANQWEQSAIEQQQALIE